jgi:predicted AAA+ superfamily ATPase
VRGYFDILVDTLVATWVPAWTKRTKRRVIQAPRFWFFDIGIVNELTRRGTLGPGSTDYGAAFEHFIFMELRAHALYAGRDHGLPVSYWRTASGIEVDFILGNAEVAVEVKSTDRPTTDHLKGLRAWQEEHPNSRCILVCRVPRARRAEGGIEILPWREFLASLWKNEIRAQ